MICFSQLVAGKTYLQHLAFCYNVQSFVRRSKFTTRIAAKLLRPPLNQGWLFEILGLGGLANQGYIGLLVNQGCDNDPVFSDRWDRQLPLHSSFIMIESNEQIEPDKRPWLLCQDMSGACFSPNQGHTWLQQLRLMLVNVRNLGSSVVAQITSERKFLRFMLP